MRYFIKLIIIGLVFMMSKVSILIAETKPLMIEITQGVIKPMPIALSQFTAIGDTTPQYVDQITSVIMADLVGSGLFREIPKSAHVSANTNFNAPVKFADWRVINADALITGSVNIQGDKLILQFRLFDVFAQKALGEGLQFQASIGNWRRMAHKISDAVYSRLTGEAAYFDSRVVYISEQGPKNARKKRLTIMDYDGANSRFLTDDNDIVLAPRFSPNNEEIVYTSYETGVPKVDLMGFLFGDILAITVRDIIIIWCGGLAVIAIVSLIWKSLLASTVSYDIAVAEGLRPDLANFLFMVLMAGVIAISMKIVGVLLITALLIIPAATARRFSGNPEVMAVMASVLGAGSVWLGLEGSLEWDTPAGPSIVVAALAFFITSVLPFPKFKKQIK